MILIRVLATLLAILFICSISIVQGSNEHEREIMIVVTIPQLINVVQEIGGSRVNVEVLVPPGIDPHTYELGGREIKLLEKCRVIVMTGPKHLYLEDRIKDLLKEGVINAEVIDYEDYIAEGLELKYIPGFNRLNPHGYFLSYKGVVAIAKSLVKVLENIDPDNKVYYESRLSEFLNKLNTYFGYAKEMLNRVTKKDGKIVAASFSPVPQYLLEDLGIELRYVLVLDPHQELDPRSIEELINMVTNNEIDIFILTDFDIVHEGSKLIKVLSDMNIPYVIIPTLTINDTSVLAISTASGITAILSSTQPRANQGSKSTNSFNLFWVLLVMVVAEFIIIIMLVLRIHSLRSEVG